MFRAPLVVAACAAGLLAQDPVASGPQSGTSVPPLPTYAPAGPDAGLDLDVAALIGDGPGAVLFVHELTRNVAPLVRGLDELADSHAVLGLTAAVVLLAADRGEAERRAEGASRSLRMARPMLVSVDGLEGPGAWALNRRAALTLVLCKDGAVHRSVAFTDTGRQDLGQLRSLVEEVTGPIPESPGELRRIAKERLPTDVDTLRARAAHLALELHWRRLRVAEEANDRARRDAQSARDDRPMMRDRPAARDAARPAAERRGAAPTDDELRGLLRQAIQRDASAESLDATFEKIRTRAAGSDDLLQQANAMLELMLGLDYGNDDAKSRARAQLDAWKKR